MRFVELNNRNIPYLTQSFEEPILERYAILSHTWGPRETEVTLKDLLDPDSPGRYKSGYDKILFCGNQAKMDKIDFFWVDTCCINKEDPVDLQKAITSMFRWYQNASCCYVYLSDVSILASNGVFSTIAFKQSRWFTRGWTLQELLAPSHVKFFSKEGSFLGDKTTLADEIHEATKIPLRALRGGSLKDFTVDEIMQWTTGRKTHEPEDQAYSLLGLFGVSMALLYGEGTELAMRRLRREIGQVEESQRHANSVPKRRPPMVEPHLNLTETLPQNLGSSEAKRTPSLVEFHTNLTQTSPDVSGLLNVLQFLGTTLKYTWMLYCGTVSQIASFYIILEKSQPKEQTGFIKHSTIWLLSCLLYHPQLWCVGTGCCGPDTSPLVLLLHRLCAWMTAVIPTLLGYLMVGGSASGDDAFIHWVLAFLHTVPLWRDVERGWNFRSVNYGVCATGLLLISHAMIDEHRPFPDTDRNNRNLVCFTGHFCLWWSLYLNESAGKNSWIQSIVGSLVTTYMLLFSGDIISDKFANYIPFRSNA